MTAATSSLLAGLHLDGRDGVWEIACAPHSQLSESTEAQGLKPRRINLHSGYDLYKPETWVKLRELRRQHRPRRLWFSLPCTKWCSWTSVNFNTAEKRERLGVARRKERKLLWNVNVFVKESVSEDAELDVYFEWPHPCFGWKQLPMEDLAAYFEQQGIPWLPCRIDGCNYEMRDSKDELFVRKRWLTRTTNEKFFLSDLQGKAVSWKSWTSLHHRRERDCQDLLLPLEDGAVHHSSLASAKQAPLRHPQLVERRDDLPALMEDLDVDPENMAGMAAETTEVAAQQQGPDVMSLPDGVTRQEFRSCYQQVPQGSWPSHQQEPGQDCC